ncbi:hypothetical protein ACWDTP_04560 [Mycobacterium sp. NPDC003449]
MRKTSNRRPVKNRAIIEALVPQPKHLYVTLACCGSVVRVDHYDLAADHYAACIQGMFANQKISHTHRIDRDPEAGPYIRDTDVRRPRRFPVAMPEPLVRIRLSPNTRGLGFAVQPWAAAINTLAEVASVYTLSTTAEEELCNARNLVNTRTSHQRSNARSAAGNVRPAGPTVTAKAAGCSMSFVMLETEPTELERRNSVDDPYDTTIEQPSVDDVLEEGRDVAPDDISLPVDTGNWGPVCTDQRCVHWRLQHRYPCEIS